MSTSAQRKKYNWTLPDKIERRLGGMGYGQQRAIGESGHLLIILHAPPALEDRERTEIVFLRKPDGQLLCNGQTNGEFKMNGLLEEYRNQFEVHDKSYEKSETSSDLFGLIEHLIPISRAAKNLSKALQSARQHVQGDTFIIAKRDEAYNISQNFEILLNEAKLSLDFQIAQSAETQAVKAHEMTLSQHKLNVLAAITFPIMAVATLFGMGGGLAHGLESETPFLFWFIFVVGFVLGIFTKRWVTDERGTQ